jgi:signal peptidase I
MRIEPSMTPLTIPSLTAVAQVTGAEPCGKGSPQSRIRWWRPAKLVVGWLMTGTLLATWFLLFRPQVLGGPASYVGVSGVSMTPRMHNGDMAIVEKQPSYRVGDIIAYRIPAGEPGAGSNVIHRIVGGNGITGFVTKGDHNPYADQFWHPTTANVIGRVWLHLPGLAGFLAHLRSPLQLAVAVGMVTFAVLSWPSRRERQDKSRDIAAVETTTEIS